MLNSSRFEISKLEFLCFSASMATVIVWEYLSMLPREVRKTVNQNNSGPQRPTLNDVDQSHLDE